MIRGIGVDMAEIEYFNKQLRLPGNLFLRKMFTENEIYVFESLPDTEKADYLATRWASKEAVFKALAHWLSDKTFDLRIVETLNMPDGKPYINTENELKPYLDYAGVTRIHLSITTECGFALAFVIAEMKDS